MEKNKINKDSILSDTNEIVVFTVTVELQMYQRSLSSFTIHWGHWEIRASCKLQWWFSGFRHQNDRLRDCVYKMWMRLRTNLLHSNCSLYIQETSPLLQLLLDWKKKFRVKVSIKFSKLQNKVQTWLCVLLWTWVWPRTARGKAEHFQRSRTCRKVC